MRRVLDVLAHVPGGDRGARLPRAAAVMTSAVRDAANGAEFAARVSATLGFAARILSGDDEARLTYAGATYGREPRRVPGDRHRRRLDRARARLGLPRLDADRRRPPQRAPPARRPADAARSWTRSPTTCATASWRTSRCVRTTTRCARSPSPGRRRSARRSTSGSSPTTRRGSKATSSPLSACASCWTAWPRSRSRSGARIRGVDPARAPVLVAGIVILLEVVNHFGLDRVEASERDILVGLALSTTSAKLMSTSRLSAHGHLFDCPRDRSRWRITPVGRAVVPPAAVHRHIGPGDAASSAPPAAWTTQ